MPKVPLYNEQQVDLRPLPNVRVDAPQSDMPRVGAALLSAGNSVGNIAQREQERRNADRLFRTEAQLRDEYRQFETSLQDRRGQNAWGVTNDVDAWFNDHSKGYLDGLENDAQRRLLEPKLAELRLRSLESAARFEGQERRVSLEESAKASIESATNLAAASWNNADAVAGAKRDIVQRIGVQAGFNGWTPERRTAEEAQALTNLHMQVLQAMADKDPDAARAYFTANRNEIAGADRDTVEKVVDAGEIKVKSQRESDALVAKGLTESETLRLAREGHEGAMRDAIVERVKQRFTDATAAQQAEERKVADLAWDFFARGGVDAIPVAVLNQLDGRTLTAMRTQQRQERIETNWETYYSLRRNGLEGVDLRAYSSELAPPQLKELMDEQTKPSPNVVTDESMLRVAYNQLGVTAVKDRGRLEGAFNAAKRAAQETKGNTPLTDDEKQAVLDKLLIQGEVTGSGLFGMWDSDRRRYEVAGTPDEAKFRADGAESNEVSIVTTDGDYAALPSGSVFRAPDGTVRRKP